MSPLPETLALIAARASEQCHPGLDPGWKYAAIVLGVVVGLQVLAALISFVTWVLGCGLAACLICCDRD